MKSLLAVICLLTGTSLIAAQTTPTDKTTTPPATTVPVTPSKPGVSTPPSKPGAKAKVEVKKEVELKIPGTVITRPNGTFLGLELDGNKFKLSFYDAKKKPMNPDVLRATARWPDPRGPRNLFTLLSLNGKALIANKPVLPPYNFQVVFNLFQSDDEGASAAETYTLPFRG